MRILTCAVIAVITAVALLTGCKTTEENYRAAYELATKKDNSGIDSTIYSRIRKEARPQKVVINGDTIAMRSEYVKLTPGYREGIVFSPYNIVIAQFKQLFNAKSVMKRAIEAGYTGAFIVETREPLYYVVAVSVSTPAEARTQLEKVAANPPVVLKDPCPFILKKR